MTPEEEMTLKALLWEARAFIDNSEGDLDARADLIERMDRICPPPPKIDICDRGPLCCLPKGHEGACDDLPF